MSKTARPRPWLTYFWPAVAEATQEAKNRAMRAGLLVRTLKKNGSDTQHEGDCREGSRTVDLRNTPHRESGIDLIGRCEADQKGQHRRTKLQHRLPPSFGPWERSSSARKRVNYVFDRKPCGPLLNGQEGRKGPKLPIFGDTPHEGEDLDLGMCARSTCFGQGHAPPLPGATSMVQRTGGVW